jgi:hypothetical protein
VIWWAVVVARVSFAWNHAAFALGAMLVATALPAGAGALWVRWRPAGAPPGGLAIALIIAVCLWVPVAGVLAAGAGCSLDEQCY